MENWITSFMEQFGYVGVFLLICIENLFPPIPSEIILTFGGFMTTKTDLTVLGVILAATLGSVVGAVLLYLVGRLLNIDRLELIVNRYGKILRVKVEDIHRAEAWFNRRGYWTVFFCRMIPVLRSLISIPAGMAKMHMPSFLFLTTVGTLIWNVILVTLGAKVGESWESILYYLDLYSNVVYVLIVLAGLAVIFLWVRRIYASKN